MANTHILSKDKDNVGPFISTDVVVKLKGYAFTFRRESSGYVPDPVFTPFMWKRKGDDADDDNNRKEKDVEMDTSKQASLSSNLAPSISTPTNAVHFSHVQEHGLSGTASSKESSFGYVMMAVNPFNPNPQTPHAIQLATDMRANSPLRDCLE
ncbi:hypothetical protein D1007_06989 [Hordeum vulgare]|nr:hypothetical protein D1007_06989 [Hordeum vulgare]